MAVRCRYRFSGPLTAAALALLITLPCSAPWAGQRSPAAQGHAGSAAAFLSSIAERPPTALPALKIGMRYRDARQLLLQSGWTPQRNPEPELCSGVSPDRRCLRYPELAGCSNTGLGFCKALWRDGRGQQLAVITAGEPSPGEVGTVVRWFAE